MSYIDSVQALLGQRTSLTQGPEKALQQRAEDLLSIFYVDMRPAVRDGLTPHVPPTPDQLAKMEENKRAVLAAESDLQVAFVRVVVDFTMHYYLGDLGAYTFSAIERLRSFMGRLYRRDLPYQTNDVHWILSYILERDASWSYSYYIGASLRGLIQSLARTQGTWSLTPEFSLLLERLRKQLSDASSTVEGRATLATIDAMLGVSTDERLIDTSDDWGSLAGPVLGVMDSDKLLRWQEFLKFAATARGSKPRQSWLEQAGSRVEAVGSKSFEQIAFDWLQLLGRTARTSGKAQSDDANHPSILLSDRNSDVLKGLAWSCSLLESEAICSALGDAAIASYKKVPSIGPRSVKVGNACVWALSSMPGMAPVAELQRLKELLKQPSARKQANTALEGASKRLGLSREDLEELVVPDYGLKDGVSRTQVGSWYAEITLVVPSRVDLRWSRNDGNRTQKSVPAELRRDFPDSIKSVKQTMKDLRVALQTQKSRIERLLLTDRRWSFRDWETRYLDNGLVSYLSHRLIWTFTLGDHQEQGIWQDGRIVNVRDEPLDWIDDMTEVRLWHPIDSEPEHVLVWRQWLERHEVTQPFKQAHREIYVLTDAEQQTEIYSNRFAAHVLRQHQFNALCQQRGWIYTPQGGWDSDHTPELDLPQYGLRVEYWIDVPDPRTAPMTDSGIFLYISTDQVRFSRRGDREVVTLREIPRRVFTEVLRDVDLFVGVCSIGNDPNWVDQDERRPYQDYWWGYAFGELSASAETRKSALEGLLPYIAKLSCRWELTGRFLVVRGDLRTYKIHLGSGNILMEPNDQYLCIVPRRNADPIGRSDLFLPFEGDGVLSVILSKALMLADDRNIKDPTITRQIALKSSPL